MKYTCPPGSALGEVLGIHFNHAAGISTRQNEDGSWLLKEWPESLGVPPTQDQVTQWATEQAADKPDREAAREIDGQKAIWAFALALKQQFPTLNLTKLKADTKTAYKGL